MSKEDTSDTTTAGDKALTVSTGYKLICDARKARLSEALQTLSKWCAKRSEGDHDEDTTLTMLKRKCSEIEDSVTRAGWRESARQAREEAEATLEEANESGDLEDRLDAAFAVEEADKPSFL